MIHCLVYIHVFLAFDGRRQVEPAIYTLADDHSTVHDIRHPGELKQKLDDSNPAASPEKEREALPKIFFLFMVNNSLPHAKIWARFLANAREGVEYEALVHCVNKPACMESIKPLVTFQVIETVHSEYCVDLVSPMQALLAAALGRAKKNNDDKFVFLSDSTVPVKPFSYVQSELVIERASASDFCIAPKSQWTQIQDGKSDDEYVKHHQWIVLHRSHALKVVSKNTSDFAINGYVRGTRTHLNGCLDEYFPFYAVFGSTLQMKATEFGHGGFPALSGDFKVTGPNIEDEQGHCSTFCYWGHGKNNMTKLADELKHDAGATFHIKKRHPALITIAERDTSMDMLWANRTASLSQRSLEAFRKSPFLFARKFSKIGEGLPERHFFEIIFE